MTRHLRAMDTAGRWRTGLAATLLLLCLSVAAPADALPMLLGTPAAGKLARTWAPLFERAVSRAKSVLVEFAYLDPQSERAANELGIELFDGELVIVDRETIDERGPRNYTWRGIVRGHAHSDALLTVVDGRIAGSIVVADEQLRATRTYELLSDSAETQTLRLIDLAGFLPDHPPGAGRLVASPRSTVSRRSAHDKQDARADTVFLVTVDLMVLYSNQTAAAASLTLDAQIQHAVDRTNLAYESSDIGVHLRLVHYAALRYDESMDFAVDLSRLTSGEGAMTEAHALRERYGADVTTLLVENTDYCGLGWIGADAEHAFNVVSRGCASTNLTLAHEIGHNFGARHEIESDAAATPYPYGHGYVHAAGGWRTVMAEDVGTPRIAYFSNPNITYGSPPVPIGNVSTADVARVHNERAQTVASFRQATAAIAPSACTVSVTPPLLPPSGGQVIVTGDCTDGGATTTWRWTRDARPVNTDSAQFSDWLPPNDTESATSYLYSAVACNATSCAPAVRIVVMVAAFPLVTMAVATRWTESEATLNAIVSSNGAITRVFFDYGTSTAYGSRVESVPNVLPPDIEEMRVYADISALACGTTYHFRAVAESVAGVVYGDEAAFTTMQCVNAQAVDVIEFYNATLDHYFVTWRPDEIAALDADTTIRGWKRTGQSFKSYPLPQQGASAVCRYYIPPPVGDSHFLGRGKEECDAVARNNPSFVLEDAAFLFIYLPAAGSCPPHTTPVYRLYSNRPDVNHRYTTDVAVRVEMVAKGWIAEGDGPDLVVMCGPDK